MVNEGQTTRYTDTVAVLVLLFQGNSWSTAQGTEHYCCDEVTQNCVQINWNARTTPKKRWNHGPHEDCVTFPPYFQAPTLSRTKVRRMYFSPNFSSPRPLKREQPLWYSKESNRPDILVYFTFSFFLCSALHWISIILQQVREVQLKALRSPLSAPLSCPPHCLQ